MLLVICSTAGLPYQKQTNWLKKPRELRLYRPEGR
jgi:hypothetical protein